MNSQVDARLGAIATVYGNLGARNEGGLIGCQKDSEMGYVLGLPDPSHGVLGRKGGNDFVSSRTRLDVGVHDGRFRGPRMDRVAADVPAFFGATESH